MGLPEDRIPLDRAALLISAAARPDLDVDAQLRRLDGLAERVSGDSVSAVSELLFVTEELEGDTSSYDDPLNSYLDQVLERRRGIPITLSVVLMEVARRRGVQLEAVGMPGHFLVRDPSDPDHLIDCFSGGRRLTRGECEGLLKAMAGPDAALTDAMLSTTGPLAILTRMLANLDGSFARREDRKSMAWVCDLRLALPAGVDVMAQLQERVQLVERLVWLGAYDRAGALLEHLAGRTDDERLADSLLGRAQELQARLN
ncbi:MAG TPA: transglutaminase-like domain-containing protein [Acidimicrobiales bacterium]|jgi:regulator of sirC expression with transglutaminase-like and TPR domain|nr:transglutaminase-like domain-containing protein [Acidimicrobiales bacterium]